MNPKKIEKNKDGIIYCCCHNCKHTSPNGCSINKAKFGMCLSTNVYKKNKILFCKEIKFIIKFGFDYKLFEPKKEIIENVIPFIKKDEFEI